jgi:hypothetical protein
MREVRLGQPLASFGLTKDGEVKPLVMDADGVVAPAGDHSARLRDGEAQVLVRPLLPGDLDAIASSWRGEAGAR